MNRLTLARTAMDNQETSFTRTSTRHWAADILAQADIRIDGSQPWDIRVHHDAFFARVLREGSLGLGESYMDGWWDCDALDQFFARLLRIDLYKYVRLNPHILLQAILVRATNRQSRARSFQVGEHHYDIGNDLYAAMLDPTMTYSCGYWKDATTLEQAQLHKLNLICRKLNLQAGQSVLDIGCGWGGFAAFAAKNYGVNVVGITVSREQKALADERCKDLPVDIRLQDYRDVDERFDAIVSVGMFEHVGAKNYRTYMETAHRCLREDGMFLLHTIGNSTPSRTPDPWMDRYIFPNGILPAASQITTAYEGLFVMEDWHNFSAYYDKTLMAWHENVEQAWASLGQTYDERFRRMWKYYLLSCAGLFRARGAQLWQIVLSPKGVPGEYVSVR